MAQPEKTPFIRLFPSDTTTIRRSGKLDVYQTSVANLLLLYEQVELREIPAAFVPRSVLELAGPRYRPYLAVLIIGDFTPVQIVPDDDVRMAACLLTIGEIWNVGLERDPRPFCTSGYSGSPWPYGPVIVPKPSREKT